MPKSRGKAAKGGRDRKGKGVAKAARPKAQGAKPATRKWRRVVPPPPVTPVVPEAVSAVEVRKEGHMAEAKQLTPGEFLATVLVPQYSRDTGHMCWDCQHFKPVLKGSKFPPADTIGWCTMIHWPFYWCVTDFNVVKKCYAFGKGTYTTKKF